MKTIKLTRGYEAIVDDEDFEELSKHRWCAHSARSPTKEYVYAMRGISAGGKNRCIKMHRQIMGHPEGKFVDHIDGNTLDNRRCNLRVATHSQNIANSTLRNQKLSEFRGVFRQKNRWRVLIRSEGQGHYLGSFISEIAAANAYDQAARRLHGQFARLNFPYGIG